jgi:isopenicillin N synthase-like dioxygenase
MGGERTLGRVDQREQIDIGAERPAVPADDDTPAYWLLEGPNLWPETLPAVREVAEEWLTRLDGVATRLLRAWEDLGVLTLLSVEDGKAGLQVEKDGEWLDVVPPAGAFVVNIGELLEIATDGYLKATLHRVVSPPAGTERISIPYFHGPALDATIPAIDLPPALAADSPGVTLDPANPLHAVFGDNWLKSRLRAHPNVVEAQYPHLLQSPRREK